MTLSNGPPGGCGIAVMAKASELGRTKTRLVPPLNCQEASAFNTAFLRDVADNILAAAERANISGYFAFGPPGSETFFKDNLPAEIDLFECWYAHFGDCLHNALDQLFMRNHSMAIVLNSDSPTLPTSLLIDAVQVLAQPGEQAVLGPAEDGGYYLLGLKTNHRRLFEDIDWSTDRVARQTQERAAEIGLPMHVLPAWYDVDDMATLTRLTTDLLGGHSFDRNLIPFGAPHTTRLIHALLASQEFRSRFVGTLPLRSQGL
jgi:rSAM/selenodomain-associated transferase 1